MAQNGIHVLLCREQTTCILSVCVGFRASQMVWQCLCRQKKCDAEVSDYLAKSFHLMTRRTLNKQHGCVAATGIISRLLGLVYTCRPRPTVQSVLHVHFVDRPRPTLLHFSITGCSRAIVWASVLQKSCYRYMIIPGPVFAGLNFSTPFRLSSLTHLSSSVFPHFPSPSRTPLRPSSRPST